MLKDPPYHFHFSFVKFVILIVVPEHTFLQDYFSFFGQFLSNISYSGEAMIHY